MRKVLILTGILVSCSCFGQKPQTPLVDKAFAFTDSVLKAGVFAFKRQELIISHEQAAISKRYSAAIAKNREWWKAYAKHYIDLKQPMPYHENFGITKKEYERYLQLSENPPPSRLKSLGIQKITITKKAGAISFHGMGALAVLDSLTIHIHKKIITLGKDTIPVSDEINAPVETPFGQWHGYSWHFIQSNFNSKGASEALKQRDIILCIGKSIPGKQLILTLSSKRTENGVIEKLFDIIGFIQ
ncbi:hypothetical protein D3H65_23205 [Paraflavitalea soli]|uniref:Uncharacterized protein n=1 Tax=Paraflavitalea soli TaxID=2315862 RepID=A0A3B7MTK8_9BACT|nr:hypothetical protein D3H65_23205 [Paraflavitalea soli]